MSISDPDLPHLFEEYYFQSSSSSTAGFSHELGQQKCVNFAGMEQPCLPYSKASLGQHFKPCVSLSTADFFHDLGQHREVIMADFGKPCLPSSMALLEQPLHNHFQPFYHFSKAGFFYFGAIW